MQYALLTPNKWMKSGLRGTKQKKIQIIPLNLDLSVESNSKLAYSFLLSAFDFVISRIYRPISIFFSFVFVF